MSIMNQITASGASTAWSQDQVRLAIGMKLQGATRKDIAAATDHPVHSVTYILTRRFKDDEAISTFTGFTSESEYTEFAKRTLEAPAA